MNFCTLASGSNGNSSILIGEDKHILIDAGYSNRSLCTFMKNIGVNHEEVAAIFITHEHSDHVKGLSVFLKNHNVPCFAPRACAKAICEYSPEIESRVVPFNLGDEIEFLNLNFKSIATPHDTPESTAYYIEGKGKKILYATDLGHIPEGIEKRVEGLDLFVIESNYDDNKLEYGPYPRFLKERIASENGHLSNLDASKIALKAAESGAKRIILAHLSQENNTPDLAYKKTHEALTMSGFIPGIDLDLQVAPRGMCGKVVAI